MNRQAWIALALLLAMVAVEGAIPPQPVTAPTTENAALRTVMAMAGQFRVVFANLLWIKVDKYHHEHIRKDPDWTKDTDILPMLRLITWLDPHFVQAYQVAAFMLSDSLGRYEHARQLLEEGIRHNPNSYELYEEMGMAILRARKDYRAAYPYLTRALSLAQDEFDRQRLQRFCETVRRKMGEENRPAQAK